MEPKASQEEEKKVPHQDTEGFTPGKPAGLEDLELF